jgi:hypothetical protein
LTRLNNPTSGTPSGAAGGELGGNYPNPTVNATHSGSTHVTLGTIPSTQAFSDAAAGGAATDASKTDHKHGMPAHAAGTSGHPQPATTVTDDTTYSVAKAVGTATTYAREDHDHGTSGHDAHANTTGITATDHHAAPVAGPDADITIDVAGAAGTASTFARSGHGHKVATSATSAVAIGTAAAGTSGHAPSRDDHVHPTGAGTPSTQAFGDAAATGTGPAASMTDHKHAWPALGTTTAAVGTSAGGSATTPSKSDHVHATGAGTPSTQAFNDAAAVGTGPAAAMTDHKHAMPDGILRSTITANGDLLVGSGNDAVARLAVGAAGAAAMSNGTTVLYAKPVGFNASTAAVTGGFAVNTYMTGSSIALPASGVRAKATYHCTFDMVKTAFGTATPIITVVIGTAQSTADTVRYTFTFGAGTGAIDTAIFEVWIQFRSVGSGTSAVLAGYANCDHHLAATGMTTTGASGRGIILPGASAGFDSTTAGTFIGLCFNGGASFVGTNTVVEAQAYDFNS